MATFENQVFSLIAQSQDGYGLVDKKNILVYANQAFHDYFYTSEGDVGVTHFDSIIRRNHRAKRGVYISSGDVEEFINYINSVRRSKQYRLFEVDYIDKRWFLFSEQTSPEGEVLLHLKDITKQKLTEFSLISRMDKLERLALTDELTGLGNRRAFKDSTASEISRIERSGFSAAMLVIDLDHFKQVNDKHGHGVGDLALAHCAAIMKKSIRPSDIIGRIGGEEFAVFLADTLAEEAHKIANRIVTSIANSTFIAEGETIPLTTSVGLAVMKSDISFGVLYEVADQALYMAKEQGRNRVCQVPVQL